MMIIGHVLCLPFSAAFHRCFFFLTRSKSQLMVCSHTAEPGSVQQVEMCSWKEHKFAILDVQVTACGVCERSREIQYFFGGLSFPGS